MSPDNEPLVVQRSSPVPWILLVLVLGGAGFAIWKGKEMFDEAEKRSAQASKDRDDARALKEDLEKKLTALQASVTTLEREVATVSAEAEQLSGQLEQKEAELSKLKATFDSLEDKMKAEIKKGDIHLTHAGGRIRVDLVDKVLFDSGEADLSARGQEVLARVGEVLARVDDKAIQVSGHTDDSPITNKEIAAKFATNWELSVARAVNVVRFLTEKAKVPPGRLLAAGYGQYHPAGTNANPQGRARNRRIEILLTPLLDALKTPAAKPAAPAPAPAPAKKK